VGKAPESYTKFLDKNGLKGARIGILREPMGNDSEPDSADFKAVTVLFDKAIADLKAAGADVVDPIVIPRLNELLAKRGAGAGEGLGDSTPLYFARNPNSPYKTKEDLERAPDYGKIMKFPRAGARSTPSTPEPVDAEYIARDELRIIVAKVMADHRLDAIVHKSVEHTPTLIKDGINPPYVNHKGAPHLNTFLIWAASIAVPAGFTPEGLPVGITFFGRPYSEPTIIKYAYAYEQATHHRKPPKTTPPLPATAGTVSRR
jgi:Asp-tRNA(Asn)/Glu-tRNA(Gln) amidotransferase A subunit family amidase